MKFKKEIIVFTLLVGFISCVGVITNNYTTKDDRNIPTRDDRNRDHGNLMTSAWTGSIKYDFESDTIGQDPTGEDLTIYEPPGCGYVEVNNVASRKCTVINKTGGSDRVYLRDNIGDSNYTAGEIHFWAYHDSSGFAVVLSSAKNEILIDMVWDSGNIRRNGPSGPILTSYTYDTWIEVEIYFNMTQGWMFDLGDTRYGDGYAYPFNGAFTANASNILWASYWSGGGNGDFCVDDIGYDNLVTESGYYDLTGKPIYIDDSDPNYNWSKTALENPWCSGSGTWNDPYIIKYVLIDGKSSGSCITIHNSNVCFIIRNCIVYNAGSGSNVAGIKLENTNNGILINNNCSNNQRGIFLYYNCRNNLIKDNIANNNSGLGIGLEDYCRDNLIIDNIANNNSGLGISLDNYCDNNTISGNLASGPLQNNGIRLDYKCEHNIISGNIANENLYNGITIQDVCDNNTISGNIVNNNTQYGINLYVQCDNNTISGNTANNNSKYGIYLYFQCDSNKISGNYLCNNSEQGVYLDSYCNNNSILENTIYNNSFYGIYLSSDCDDNLISGNDVSENGKEIGMFWGAGIYLYFNCNNNNITRNVINHNSDDGIFIFSGCDSTIISENLIKNNVQSGIEIYTGCNNSLIYYNSFIGNGIQASDSGSNNKWNQSEFGNYWDNHTSPDLNNDGIVDNPYTWITGSANSEDSFPLVESPINLGEKIHIDDTGVNSWNWSNTAKLKAWCSGKGTYADPYIIDGLEINGGGSGTGILIENSRVFFIIENCIIYNSGTASADVGITLDNTSNGILKNNNCSNNYQNGIYLINGCENNTIISNIIGNKGTTFQQYGIILGDNCIKNKIINNKAYNNIFEGIYLYSSCNNNMIVNNTAIDNMEAGIILEGGCNNNTISGNIASNIATDNQLGGIVLITECNNNTIKYNNIKDNYIDGIYIGDHCVNNTISSNIIGNEDTKNQDYGIELNFECNSNRIINNSITNVMKVGINLENHCVNNTISSNSIGNKDTLNQLFGICLDFNCDYNNISENFIFYNLDLAILVNNTDCNNNVIQKNILVSEDLEFISNSGTDTLISLNYVGTERPSFILEDSFLSISSEKFTIILNIFSETHCSGWELNIKIWWNGSIVQSSNITELEYGVYNISLSPIFVEPNDSPILLNITISALHHLDKTFNLYLKVDPKAVNKAPGTEQQIPAEGSGGGGGGGGKGYETSELNALTITLLIVGIASAIVIITIAIYVFRKRMAIDNREPI